MRSPNFYILVLIAILFVALLYLFDYNRAIKLNFALTERRQKLSELHEKVDSLRVKLSTLTSFNRIRNFR
jgi:cell division protein FtsL